jgi:HPt (histidine-containing phosphotransfer) domain-containing protein
MAEACFKRVILMIQPVFDRDHLDRQTFGDADLKREILALFLRQCEKLFGLMQDASAHERRDICHTLKGSARSIGAFPLAAAAEHLESLADDAAGLPIAFEAIGLEIKKAIQEIRSGQL